MAKARRQNTGETEHSARAFAASETAESHEDRDAARRTKKNETSSVVTTANSWQSKDLLALTSRQQHLHRHQGCRDEVEGMRNFSICHAHSRALPLTLESCVGRPDLTH